MTEKSTTAFRTIGEVARDLGVPQHRLRYWETRFPQVKPVTRAGDRRYYRPEDVALLRRIHALLGESGYTVRGVQALLMREAGSPPVPPPPPPPPSPAPSSRIDDLRRVRALLADALAADG